MSYNEYRYPDGMIVTSNDNLGHSERPSFGAFNVRRNSLHLASTRDDFIVKDTVAGRKQAAEALERGMLVFDLCGNPLTAEDLSEAE